MFLPFFSSQRHVFLHFPSSISPCSRLNRNKLQFLPELLFQSNPKLGRLWVHFDFLFFSSSPHSWSLSDSPPSFRFPFCAALDVLRDPFENTTMVSEVLSWLRVRVSRQVTQCRSVLLSRVEKGSECQMCAFVWVCLILRGESVPAVNVLLGLVWNFYSGILSFPRV